MKKQENQSLHALKVIKRLKIFSLTLGIFFFLIGLTMSIFYTINEENKIQLKAEVVEVHDNFNEEEYYVVRYVIDGVEYINHTNFFYPGVEVGDYIDIYVNKDNYNYVGSQKTDKTIISVFNGIGLIFLIGDIAFILSSKIKKNNEEELINCNQYVYAKILSVKQNKHIRIGGISPYNIFCEYKMNGMTYVFKSKNLYDDPSEYINSLDGHIKVYYQGDKFEKYCFDLKDFENSNK